MSVSQSCLYLFSSNQSQLYAQDILNVLAAPEGHPYTFRYDAKYVAENLREAWTTLQDTPVVVLFSLQQKARFQAPAFIPIRSGYVLRTHREGDSYFVEFRIRGYIALPEGESQSAQVARFAERLGDVTDVPYSTSVSLGSQLSLQDVDVQSDSSVLFARTGTYLARTETFENASFLRILGIRPSHPTSKGSRAYLKTHPAQPLYKLKARSTYELVIFHSQPQTPPQPAPFQIFVDDNNVRTLSSGRFTVASRYDEVTVRLATADATGLEDHETAIVLEPGTEVEGPVVTLKVLVEADRGRAVGIASTQALALLMVGLAGVFSSAPIGFRVSLAVLGALGAVGLGLVGAAALRPPTLPSVSPHPPQPSPH